MRVRLYVFSILMLFSFAVVGQDYKSELKEAQSLYDEGKFLAAAQKYEFLLLESGQISFEVYYNLGNAYFKADNLPSAILNYERAKKIKPTNEDLLFNLEIANQQVVDKFEKVPELGVSKWYKAFILSLSSNIWAYFSIISFIITLLGLAVFLAGTSIATKRPALAVVVITLFISVVSLLFSSTSKNLIEKNIEAVIFSPNVTATSAPAQQSTSLFVLHEGTKVKVIEQQNKWVRIKISDGNIGWLPAEDVQII